MGFSCYSEGGTPSNKQDKHIQIQIAIRVREKNKAGKKLSKFGKVTLEKKPKGGEGRSMHPPEGKAPQVEGKAMQSPLKGEHT